MHVSDVMSPATVSDTPGETLRAAAARMWDQQTGSLLVLEGGGLVGIITERDVLRAIAAGMDVDAATVGDVMSRDVATTTSDAPLHTVARNMASRWIRHLPVVDAGVLVGVVSLRDLAAVLAALGPSSTEVSLAADDLVRSRRLARIEAGDLD